MNESNCVGDNELGEIYVADCSLSENMSVFLQNHMRPSVPSHSPSSDARV